MNDLGNPKTIQKIIKEHQFSVQKKYGQNFLVDANILEGIVSAAEISKADTVLEIGPGMGALTQYLLEAAGQVVAVEVDRMLIPILKDNLKDYNNLILIHGDIMKLDLNTILSGEAEPPENDGVSLADKSTCVSSENIQKAGQGGTKKIKVVANLPYYITTPIIMELLERQENLESITVMVQKEVAQRMQEGPGSKSYGALSLAVQYYSEPKILLNVSRNCFLPKPDVDSAVIRLDIYKPEERPVKVEDPAQMFRLIRAAFNQRRKTLVNALSGGAETRIPKEKTAEVLAKMNLSETVRGEALTLEEFAQFSDYLSLRRFKIR